MKTKEITCAAVFAALTAIFSQISLPIGPIPINFALCAPILAGMICGPRSGVISQGVYVLVGMAGVPVFAGFKGGIGVLTGPTGGFVEGYIICAVVTGILFKRLEKHTGAEFIAAVSGVLVCYVPGLIWFSFQTGNSLMTSILICVLPFIPGDLLKILFCKYIASSIKKRKIKL